MAPASYLIFEERPNPGKKTKLVMVIPVNGGPELGVIRWFGRWRQYVFQPATDTVFNPVCMREIADKSYSLTLEQRAR